MRREHESNVRRAYETPVKGKRSRGGQKLETGVEGCSTERYEAERIDDGA